MSLNVERFMQVKAMILAEPARIHMGVWRETDVEYFDPKPACSTVGCIAGWSAIAYLMEKKKLKRPKTAAEKMESWEVQDIAEQSLGMGERDSWQLFDESHWPVDLNDALRLREPGTPEYAAVVAQAIDRYVACDGHWENDEKGVA